MSDRLYLQSFMVLKDNEGLLWIAIPCIALEQNAFGKVTARGADLCEAPESSGLGSVGNRARAINAHNGVCVCVMELGLFGLDGGELPRRCCTVLVV